MGKVIGIGGVFFKSKSPKKLNAWYQKHLGVEISEWGGATFDWDANAKSPRQRMTVWNAFDADTKYFGPSRESFMVNFIVDDLDAVVAGLKKSRIAIDAKGIEASEFGRFAWVMDPDGRKVELWEPPLKVKAKKKK